MNNDVQEQRYADISARLKECLLAIYGTVNAASEALGMSAQSLSPYLNGRRAPGNKVLPRLEKAGVDVAFVLTGRKANEEFNQFVRELAPKSIYDEEPSGETFKPDVEISVLKKLYEEKVVQGETYRNEIAELKLRIAELERLLREQKAPKTYHGAKHVSEFDLEDEIGPSGIKVEPEKPIHVVPMMQVAATPIMEINGDIDDRSEYDRL